MTTTIQTTLDGDWLVPLEMPDGSVADVSKDVMISSVAEAMVSHAHSMPYGGIDWPQKEGFPIRILIEQTTERAIRDVVQEEGWDPLHR